MICEGASFDGFEIPRAGIAESMVDCHVGRLLPYGTEPTGHAWLHSRCWEVWHANRKSKAVTILSLTVGAG